MKLPHRRQFLHLAAGAAALPIVLRTAKAQTYPTRPITLIVPFPPGGSTDVGARIVADTMSRTLGQQIVVQNVSGAGGTTGSTRAMRADPDGYTILMGQMGTHAASVALYPNLAYKPDVDFEPIGMVTAFPLIVAARKDFPAQDGAAISGRPKLNAAVLALFREVSPLVREVLVLLPDSWIAIGKPLAFVGVRAAFLESVAVICETQFTSRQT